MELHSRTENLVGKSFGDWTVVNFAEYKVYPSDKKKRYAAACWECRCKCGMVQNIRAVSLKNGTSTRCRNCAQQDVAKKNMQKLEHSKYFCTTFLNKCRDNATKGNRNYKFEIILKDLDNQWEKQEGKCALTGKPLEPCSGLSQKEMSKINTSIDRKNNNIGYTRNNIQLVTKEVNILRGNMPLKKFKKLCKEITNHSS